MEWRKKEKRLGLLDYFLLWMVWVCGAIVALIFLFADFVPFSFSLATAWCNGFSFIFQWMCRI